MHISEWGTFIDPNDRLMVNMLTDLWDCKEGIAIDKTTATQGDLAIINPFVNMLAATTPSWMRDNIKAQFGGWGLSSRIIFVFADSPRQIVAWPGRGRRGSDTSGATKALVTDLRRISRLSGPFENDDAVFDAGQRWREEHIERHRNIMKMPHSNPWLGHFLARKFDYIVKLAMVLSTSRKDDLRITLAEWREAVRRMDEVECELDFIFGTTKAEAEVSRATRLNHAAWEHLEAGLKANGRIARRDVHRFLSRYMDYRSSNDFIAHLVAMDYIRQVQDPEGQWVELPLF